MDLSKEWVSSPASLFTEEQELQSHLPVAPKANPQNLYIPGVDPPLEWIHWSIGTGSSGKRVECRPVFLLTWWPQPGAGFSAQQALSRAKGQGASTLPRTHSQAQIWRPRCQSCGSSRLVERRQSFVERTDQPPHALGHRIWACTRPPRVL